MHQHQFGSSGFRAIMEIRTVREKGKEKLRSQPARRSTRQLIGKISQVPTDPLVQDQERQIGKLSEQTKRAPKSAL